MAPKCIAVRSATGAYPVLYGRGLSGKLAARVEKIVEHTGLFLLSSPRVARYWRSTIEPALRRAGLRATILFDDRETAKSIATVERLCRQLVRAGADRRSVIVAMGGGVVGDVCGFVAASYLRGVRLVHLPTTLVAQVDSAIGGKTGVNLPEGKNLVGAFYPPEFVLADPLTLATLSDREFRSGLYEVIKYGVIADARLFAFLENRMDSLVARDVAALDFVIPRSIAIKASVVSRDEREAGLREILNFGHTFAHAFETATAYRRYLHGEAVGWGMIAAARLAASQGIVGHDESRRIESLVRSVGPLPPLPSVAPKLLIAIMASDKKTRGGKLRFVMSRRIGTAETAAGTPRAAVRSVLKEMQSESRAKR